jgi:nucleotide-binding universal stress UspA family protein
MIQRILVPTDFSEPSDAALECARIVAHQFGASLHPLQVANEPASTEPAAREATINEAGAHLTARAAGTASQDIGYWDAASTIVAFAARMGADLIVMGTHGRTGLANLLMGSVSGIVARTAPCPVLIVRHPLGVPQPSTPDQRAEPANTTN